MKRIFFGAVLFWGIAQQSFAIDCHNEFYEHYLKHRRNERIGSMLSFTGVVLPFAIFEHKVKEKFNRAAQLLNEAYYAEKDLLHTKYLDRLLQDLSKEGVKLTHMQLQQALLYIDTQRVLFCTPKNKEKEYRPSLSWKGILSDVKGFFSTDIGNKILVGEQVIKPFFPVFD